MITEIGIIAGEIWHYLDENGQTSLYVLSKGIGRDRDSTLLSLGWLAREGHIILLQEEKEYKIQLRK